ncbi:MAG: dipicolinate synthase subunit DpsA [Lachnospirales bacterium]
MSRTKFAIIGGDYRYKLLKELLEKDGYIVSIYGNIYCESTNDIDSTISNSKAVIAPIPITKDDKKVYMSENFQLTVDDLLNSMSSNNVKVLIGGVISEKLKNIANIYNIKAIDLFSLEEVAINNAIPTAEGAIMTAIQESDKVLFKSKSLVLGFGRCGKVLANMLKGIGANVYVTYRKKSDEAYINLISCTPISFNGYDRNISDYDFIFNTIPAPILNQEILKRIRKDTPIIDIAQAPGGLDYNYARKLNLKAIYCPGLPGRVAPYSAAQILKSSIIDIVLDS